MQFLQAYYRGMNTHTYNTNAHTHIFIPRWKNGNKREWTVKQVHIGKSKWILMLQAIMIIPHWV